MYAHFSRQQPSVQAEEQHGAELGAQSNVQPRILNHTLGCNLACMQPDIQGSAPFDRQLGALGDEHVVFQGIRCEYGFSHLQIKLISLLLGRHGEIITYEQLAKQVSSLSQQPVSRDAVRGAMARLKKRRVLSSRQAREGTLYGAVHTVRADRICPNIREAFLAAKRNMHLGAQHDAHSQQHPESSILQIDRTSSLYLKNQQPLNRNPLERLCEEDICFHWPTLAKAGFGVSQIRQILERLRQTNKSSERIIDGLNYAEWELEHGSMVDKNGCQVDSPVKWVFICLSRNGAYRKPSDYISPEEQYEREKIESAKRLKKVQEQRIEAEFDVWKNELSTADICTILEGKNHFIGSHAQKALLKNHFTTQIWPQRIEEERRIATSRTPEGQPTLRGHAHSEAGQGLRPLEPRKDKEPHNESR